VVSLDFQRQPFLKGRRLTIGERMTTMKRLIAAVLPILLAAQIPFGAVKLVPSDWKKNFDYGVKWTELLLDSYSTVMNGEQDVERIPSGTVTTTVAMALIPEIEDLQIIDPEICQAQMEIARKTIIAAKTQKEFNRKFQTLEIRLKTIQL